MGGAFYFQEVHMHYDSIPEPKPEPEPTPPDDGGDKPDDS